MNVISESSDSRCSNSKDDTRDQDMRSRAARLAFGLNMGIEWSVSNEFAHGVERELARLFDQHRVAWEYEPHTFVLERDATGRIVEAFTPDFFRRTSASTSSAP
jgi:hypothetical protein